MLAVSDPILVATFSLDEFWKTSTMVAHYGAGATGERGAVARHL